MNTVEEARNKFNFHTAVLAELIAKGGSEWEINNERRNVEYWEYQAKYKRKGVKIRAVFVRIETTLEEEYLAWVQSPTEYPRPMKGTVRHLPAWQIVDGDDAGAIVPNIQPGYMEKVRRDETNTITDPVWLGEHPDAKVYFQGWTVPALVGKTGILYAGWSDYSGSCSGLHELTPVV